ncbi:hypothetical protein K438DRAFT_1774337 [Mycena galopus ATCC 62051]|nr:hypothetical protein K438DRAFT_1774337 [Mycena galopus ATCC 62051]
MDASQWSTSSQWPLAPASGSPLFTTFHLNTPGPASSRAAAQARYRGRHQDEERAKAGQWMQALRHSKKQEAGNALRRVWSNAGDSELFLRYKNHVQRHFGTLSGSEEDPEYMAAWNRFRFTRGDFDQEDTLFVLKYSKPAVLAPTSAEVHRCLGELNNYTLTFDFDWENAEDFAAYDRLTLSACLDDEDFEFMFRHAVPSPTMQNTST